jgi:hypothetical protein
MIFINDSQLKTLTNIKKAWGREWRTRTEKKRKSLMNHEKMSNKHNAERKWSGASCFITMEVANAEEILFHRRQSVFNLPTSHCSSLNRINFFPYSFEFMKQMIFSMSFLSTFISNFPFPPTPIVSPSFSKHYFQLRALWNR